MKYYHMIIESNRDGKREEYISHRQGAAPRGWKCVGVCGFHEAPGNQEPPQPSEDAE